MRSGILHHVMRWNVDFPSRMPVQNGEKAIDIIAKSDHGVSSHGSSCEAQIARLLHPASVDCLASYYLLLLDSSHGLGTQPLILSRRKKSCS